VPKCLGSDVSGQLGTGAEVSYGQLGSLAPLKLRPYGAIQMCILLYYYYQCRTVLVPKCLGSEVSVSPLDILRMCKYRVLVLCYD